MAACNLLKSLRVRFRALLCEQCKVQISVLVERRVNSTPSWGAPSSGGHVLESGDQAPTVPMATNGDKWPLVATSGRQQIFFCTIIYFRSHHCSRAPVFCGKPPPTAANGRWWAPMAANGAQWAFDRWCLEVKSEACERLYKKYTGNLDSPLITIDQFGCRFGFFVAISSRLWCLLFLGPPCQCDDGVGDRRPHKHANCCQWPPKG